MPRVVLLGASNLAMSLPAVIATAQQAVGPAACLIADGFGRSYGVTSRVLGRKLPGIVPCGLWDVLRQPAAAPTPRTFALLTDIGNDIGYGHDAATILGWVDLCLARLADAPHTRIVITDLPRHTLSALSEWRFQLIRALLFPTRRLMLRDVLATVDAVSAGLQALAAKYEARLVRVDPAWYGFDGIHIRRRHHAVAWAHLLASWTDRPITPVARPPLAQRWRLNWLTPAERALFGILQRGPQPAMTLSNGSTLSLY